MDYTYFILYGSIGLLLISIIILIMAICHYNNASKCSSKMVSMTSGNGLNTPQKLIDKIEYSERIIEFGKKIATQHASISFKSYIDGHSLDKITKVQIEKLIGDTSISINNRLSYDEIDFSQTLFTKEYFEYMIIDVITITIKQLLEHQ